MAHQGPRLSKKLEIAVLHQSIGWAEGLIDSYSSRPKPLQAWFQREVLELRHALKGMRDQLEFLTGSRHTPCEKLFNRDSEDTGAWKEAVNYVFLKSHDQDKEHEVDSVVQQFIENRHKIDPLLPNPFEKMFEKV